MDAHTQLFILFGLILVGITAFVFWVAQSIVNRSKIDRLRPAFTCAEDVYIRSKFFCSKDNQLGIIYL